MLHCQEVKFDQDFVGIPSKFKTIIRIDKFNDSIPYFKITPFWTD